MRQVRIERKTRRPGRPGDPSIELPTGPASDTSAAADLIGRIDRVLAD